MKQLPVWQLIHKSLQAQIPVMLLYVLESTGSSPGRQGFAMAINAAGEMEGSIGGGIMEHKFAEMAREKLKEESYQLIVKKQYHDKEAAKNQSGMICSGEQTILLFPVEQKDIHSIVNIVVTLEQDKNGTLQLSQTGMAFSHDTPREDYSFSLTSEDDWLYSEKIGLKHHLYIIGSGHCALALCRLMRSLDFYIHLFDDRSDLKTFEENDAAHEKTILHDYSELSNRISSGSQHWVVVMTVGYRTDAIAVKTLLDKNFAYFGMLGSETKVKKLITDFRAEGIPEEQLKKIHAPIGLPISSQTPEEIAISIAAEIIKVKNSKMERDTIYDVESTILKS